MGETQAEARGSRWALVGVVFASFCLRQLADQWMSEDRERRAAEAIAELDP